MRRLVEPEYIYNDPDFAQEVPHHLDSVWTVTECAAALELEVSVVRRACIGKKVLARKSGATWLISRNDALARWHADNA